MKSNLLFAALCLAALLFVGFTRQTSKPHFEYKVEYHGTISEKKLNELGAEGWELVTTDVTIKNGTTNVTGFYFKRAKQ